MEISNTGKSPNASFSFRYNANNEELEELSQVCDDDPPTPQSDPPPKSENASPKKTEKSASILDKYFKSMRNDKVTEKVEEKSDSKPEESKTPVPPKEATSSPMKDYLNRLGKRSNSEAAQDAKESNETWKIFHDFKYKIAQAVEDMKTRSVEETKEKALPRENSTSDSEESSAVKDCDQQSVGDTDNQVSSLDSSMQNLSEMTQPLTAKPTELELSCEPSLTKNNSESSDDTHKNIGQFDIDQSQYFVQENDLEVESGIEALEDTIDAFGEVTQILESSRGTPIEPKYIPSTPITAPNFDFPPNRNVKVHPVKNKTYFFKCSMYFLTIFLLLSYILFPNANVWNGFLLGVWFIVLTNNLKEWILDTYFTDSDTVKTGYFQVRSMNQLTYTIPPVKEHRPLKKFEGWLNHYRYPDYDPFTYHINKTTTAFVKLEGCNLRISYTRTKIAKRALWDEKIENTTFYQHRLYNLTGARVILLPKGLVKRRQWSKKYPICIILSEKEKIQVLEKENSSSERKSELDKKIKEILPDADVNDVNTSPEKKKKLIWRRREKSIPNSDSEPGREGLRHRLARKKHNKDKKVESASTSTDPEPQPDRLSRDETTIEQDDAATKSVASARDDDDYIDDSEISRFKEFLDETEQEEGAESQAEGEWSVHVRPSTDRHARLFLFTRTGRDKHDWYRHLMTAVSEANASAESSAADDKSVNEETKDGIEMGTYKLAEKDTVSFAKNKNNESSSEGVTINATPTHSSSFESYEKTFWPYLLKVIECHELLARSATDVGVSSQLKPTPPERSKKKKRKSSECLPAECACRTLPAEVSWLNTLVARVMFDVSRDPHTVARLQAKIQRKLHTLKLPAFMSPLAVTKLTLAGCPLVRRVRAAAADERGLWLHADVSYGGGASITILTQINLMKLKEKSTIVDGQTEESEDEEPQKEVTMSPVKGISTEKQLRKRKPAIFDSDMEDSAESSSDDESPPVQPVDSTENMLPAESTSTTGEGSSKKKFLRMVDKIATNKYFQQVTDYKYVKRGMEALSNTDIKLQLELNGLDGTLAINVPPPPHDRIWLGFVTNPQLVLKARPAVGARTLRFAHISNWIEQKLTKEFEKVLVIPNMEDIIVDVMTPTPVEFE